MMKTKPKTDEKEKQIPKDRSMHRASSRLLHKLRWKIQHSKAQHNSQSNRIKRIFIQLTDRGAGMILLLAFNFLWISYETAFCFIYTYKICLPTMAADQESQKKQNKQTNKRKWSHSTWREFKIYGTHIKYINSNLMPTYTHIQRANRDQEYGQCTRTHIYKILFNGNVHRQTYVCFYVVKLKRNACFTLETYGDTSVYSAWIAAFYEWLLFVSVCFLFFFLLRDSQTKTKIE